MRGPLKLQVFGENLPPPGNSARKGADASENYQSFELKKATGPEGSNFAGIQGRQVGNVIGKVVTNMQVVPLQLLYRDLEL